MICERNLILTPQKARDVLLRKQENAHANSCVETNRLSGMQRILAGGFASNALICLRHTMQEFVSSMSMFLKRPCFDKTESETILFQRTLFEGFWIGGKCPIQPRRTKLNGSAGRTEAQRVSFLSSQSPKCPKYSYSYRGKKLFHSS